MHRLVVTLTINLLWSHLMKTFWTCYVKTTISFVEATYNFMVGTMQMQCFAKLSDNCMFLIKAATTLGYI